MTMYDIQTTRDEMRFVGIDPGHNAGGLCALNHDGSMHSCAHWKRMKRKAGDVWRLEYQHAYQQPVTTFHTSLYTALDHLWASVSFGEYYLCIEQPFIPHRGLKGLVRLIESAGVCAGIWAPAARAVSRVSPSTWRSEVLALPGRTKAKEAEATAVQWCASRIAGSSLHHIGHIAEATCMAQHLIHQGAYRP